MDEVYPDDIFPTLPDSAARAYGPRIVSLVRQLDGATTERDEARAEVERLRDGAATLAAEWEAEIAAEFTLAASDLRDMVADPSPRQSLAMAVVTLRTERDTLRAERCEHRKCPGGSLCCCPPDHLAARIGRVRALHRPTTVEATQGECAAEECAHEDDCPTVPVGVCAECYRIGEDAYPWASEGYVLQHVEYPCPTIRALDGGE